jgi:hypothetical protein
MTPTAIGYVRRDISGTLLPKHEIVIGLTARIRNVIVGRFVVLGPEVDRPALRLLNIAQAFSSSIILVPTLAHLAGDVVKVNALCEVIECENADGSKDPKVWAPGSIQDAPAPPRRLAWFGRF